MIFISLSIAVLFISSASAFGSFGSVRNSNAGMLKINDNVITNITANSGDSVQFECYATGSPSPKIIWSKPFDGNNLLPNGDSRYEGNILKLPSLTYKSRGTYVCEATNTHSYDNKHYTLQVHSPPIITETKQKHVFNSHILLQCIANCVPQSTFKWYRNNELLIIEDKDEVDGRHTYVPIDSVISSLDISTKNNDFGGSFKCEIENELGKDEYVFEIDASPENATPKSIKY